MAIEDLFTTVRVALNKNDLKGLTTAKELVAAPGSGSYLFPIQAKVSWKGAFISPTALTWGTGADIDFVHGTNSTAIATVETTGLLDGSVGEVVLDLVSSVDVDTSNDANTALNIKAQAAPTGDGDGDGIMLVELTYATVTAS